MLQIEHIHTTTTGNHYPLQLTLAQVAIDEIPYNKNLTDQACLRGCNLWGKNGGCPPFSPSFEQLKTGYDRALIMICKILTKDYPVKILKGNYYVRWAFVETFPNTLLVNLGHHLRKHFGGFLLGTGNCRGCTNRRCSFKNGSVACINPSKRSFSMESTGILVTDLLQTSLQIRLQWWDKNDLSYIPDYMCKVVTLLGETDIDIQKACKAVSSYLVPGQ